VRIALCNEVIAPMPFPRQCEYAADGPGAAARAIGYVRGILEALE